MSSDFQQVAGADPMTGVLSDGASMKQLIERLYPICRSITGDGVRQTLEILREYVPLDIREVPTGTKVLDWQVPREWNIRQAYIARLDGTKVIDFSAHNLHVVSYSTPIDRTVGIDELRCHLYVLADRPDWIPYRTSYYSENWGFCLSQRQLDGLTDSAYRVVIDSSLENGHLTYGELLVPGRSDETVLISTHICHPSLANDNLSGISVALALAQHVREIIPRYSYRFLFAPGTIGAITWLALNEHKVGSIKHGLVMSCLGDRGSISYKQSRRGDAAIDRIAAHVLRHEGGTLLPFVPFGYDERQYCSPGYDLPVGCLMRTGPGKYREYHTSADNPDLIDGASLEHSFAVLKRIVGVIEGEAVTRNNCPKGEPQLGRRGLYRALGGQSSVEDAQMALLWVLNLSDGRHSLLDIAERADMPFSAIRAAADALAATDLLDVVSA